MAVFDVTGKLVWKGHPMDDAAEKAIKEALKDVEGGDGSSSSGLAPRQTELIAQRSNRSTQ